jgi:hypothetical protein
MWSCLKDGNLVLPLWWICCLTIHRQCNAVWTMISKSLVHYLTLWGATELHKTAKNNSSTCALSMTHLMEKKWCHGWSKNTNNHTSTTWSFLMLLNCVWILYFWYAIGELQFVEGDRSERISPSIPVKMVYFYIRIPFTLCLCQICFLIGSKKSGIHLLASQTSWYHYATQRSYCF